MGRKKKIIVTIAALGVVIGAVLIGVFASIQQTFSVSGRISFKAIAGVEAQIGVFGIKEDDYIQFASSCNSEKFDPEAMLFNQDYISNDDLTAYSTSFEKMDEETSKSADLDFSMRDSRDNVTTVAVYVFVKNVGEQPFSIELTSYDDIKSLNNLDVVIKDTIDGDYGYSNGVLVLDVGATLEKRILFSIIDDEEYFYNQSYSLDFDLQTAPSYDTAPAPSQSFLSSSWKGELDNELGIQSDAINSVYFTDTEPTSNLEAAVEVGAESATSNDIITVDTMNGTTPVIAYAVGSGVNPYASEIKTKKQSAKQLDGPLSFDIYIYSPFTVKTPLNSTNLFANLTNATSLNFDNLSTTLTTNMSGMFGGCSSLTSVDLSNFTTSNVISMANMFNGCSSLSTLDLSPLNMASCTSSNSVDSMLSGMSALTSVKKPQNLSVSIQLPKTMYEPNTNTGVSEINSSTDEEGIKQTTWEYHKQAYLSSNWQNLVSSSVGNSITNIKTIIFTKVLPPNTATCIDVGTASETSTTVISARDEDLFPIKAYISTNASDSSKYDIVFYSQATIYAPERSSQLFKNLTGLTSIDVLMLDTSKVTSMGSMFNSCSSLTSLDLTNLDTSKVTSMSSMFYECSSLTSLDLSSFDTSNVTDMGYMFVSCNSLTSLDLSGFDMTTCTTSGSVNNMFDGMSALTTLKTPINVQYEILLPKTMYKKGGSMWISSIRAGTASFELRSSQWS